MLIQAHSDQLQSINGLCISKGTKVGRAFQSYCAPFTPGEKGEKTKLWQPHCFKYLATTLLLRCFRPDYRLLPKSWLK